MTPHYNAARHELTHVQRTDVPDNYTLVARYAILKRFKHSRVSLFGLRVREPCFCKAADELGFLYFCLWHEV
jgi:hypothetical protein